ncbi:MAG: hypothetical protein EA379_01835 [Phycisphaerales bacterium]|nr:MAG: hypothetical protein EA379_01835 [Phycisphaerales bacterium]
MTKPLWFDAHLDLACLAVNARDMHGPPERATGPFPPASVTLPTLREGRVFGALATVFTEAGGEGPEGYPEGDAARAARVGRNQMEVYLTWRDQGAIAFDLVRALRVDPGVGEIRGGMGVAELTPPDVSRIASSLARDGKLHIGVLIENADPVASPDELPWWVERGVVAIGLAWAKQSRYAGGNTCETGLTDLGRAMVSAMDERGVVHDLSHLSQRATDELLSLTDRRVMASHSNCRALLGPAKDGGVNQRHISDETIREVAQRGGMIGVNLFSAFLHDGPGRARIDDVVFHVEHLCEIAGSRAHVGLGSDMDGGFGADRLPEGVDGPRDLDRIAEALRDRGWSDEDVAGFAHKNWLRFWREVANDPRRRPVSRATTPR